VSTELTKLWQGFFGPSDDLSVGSKVYFWLLRRAGDLLIAATGNDARGESLDLYAAQTRAARSAKTVLRSRFKWESRSG